MMTKSAIILCIGLLVTLVIGMFTFTYLKRQELNQSLPIPDTLTDNTTDPYRYAALIDTKHFYSNGLHTFVGVLNMPTPCDLLEVASTVRESFPEQIVLEFKVINNAPDCEQIETPQRFKVEATASADAIMSATFMGRLVELNVIPAGKGEVPEDFEIFIKG